MEYNRIHDVLLESDDGGAFYTGRDPSSYGNIIRCNLVYRAGSTNPLYRHGYWHAVYLDDFACGVTVEKNVFTDNNVGVLASGWDTKVNNNIIINSPRPIVFQFRRFLAEAQAKRIEDMQVDQPPYSERYPTLKDYAKKHAAPGQCAGSEGKRNISIGSDKPCVILDRVNNDLIDVDNNLDLKECVDFAGITERGFTLKADSPVLQKVPGFSPIDFGKIGLYRDTWRRTLPGENADAADCCPPKVADSNTYLASIRESLSKKWPDNRGINIVCHGHSVPAGYFQTPVVDTFNAYPHLLHKAIKDAYPFAATNVIVTAIGGETSESGAARFEKDVLVHKPDVLLIDYSLNDRRMGLKRAEAAWTDMITKAQAQGIKVILLTPTADQSSKMNDPKDPLNQHAKQVRRLAAQFHVGLVDSLAEFKDYVNKGQKLEDLMAQFNHPNRKGHDLVAAAAAKRFLPQAKK